MFSFLLNPIVLVAGLFMLLFAGGGVGGIDLAGLDLSGLDLSGILGGIIPS